jgi:hypothetical protein
MATIDMATIDMATTEHEALSELSFDELTDELATLAAHIYAGTCRWLELVAELDRRGGWAGWGCRSCAEWLAWRCGLTPRAAREHVRVARRLGELPLIHRAFARGEVSYAKVRALTRVAAAEDEEELLRLARSCTAARLERVVRGLRRLGTAEAREPQEAAHLDVFWQADGTLAIHGQLTPEDGALLLRALDAMRDGLWKDGRGSAEPRPSGQAAHAEAPVAVAEAALARPDAGRPGGERYQVVVHADEAAPAGDGDGGCELEDGSAIAPDAARRLACDASVIRDGNLVLLCRRHHRLVHEGGYTVDPNGNFSFPWGQRFPSAPALPRGDPDQLAGDRDDLALLLRKIELERHRDWGYLY